MTTPRFQLQDRVDYRYKNPRSGSITMTYNMKVQKIAPEGFGKWEGTPMYFVWSSKTCCAWAPETELTLSKEPGNY